MMLKDMKIKKGAPVEDPDPSGATYRTINGVYKPEITIAPGELQFWRIGNFSADIYYDLVLPGVTFYDLAVDGNLRNRIVPTDELVIPPGGRREVLVRGPKAGKYKLKTKKFQTGPGTQGDDYPGQRMATLVSQGSPVEEIPLPTVFPAVPDLRTESPDVYRTVVFDDTDDPNVFVIDDKVWDENRVDQTVELGALEEWRLQNASRELHVFHIHQGDFQIVEINGVAQSFTGYQDVVSLPYATKDGPGEVVMRIKFDPPIIVGEYVYHCHIVQHEDQGMMANIVVEDQLAKVMRAADPPDLVAQVLPSADGSYWCGGDGAAPLPAVLESRL
jgi:FtsP/CotA-like multicopper oxidase with cupredoxin domain